MPASDSHVQGDDMAQQGSFSDEGAEPVSTGHPLARLAEKSQIDFELEFFGGILERNNLFFPAESKTVAADRAALPGTLMTVPYPYPLDPAGAVPGLVVNWGGVGKIGP